MSRARILRTLTMFLGFMLVVDVFGLVTLFAPIDAWTKRWIVTVVLSLTMVEDIAVLGFLNSLPIPVPPGGAAPAVPPIIALSERKIKIGLFAGILALLLGAAVLGLLWFGPFGYTTTVVLVAIFLVAMTLADLVKISEVIRRV